MEFLHERTGAHFRRALAPSIDRIIPSLGYVPGNIRLVVYAVNAAMNEWGEAVFWQIVKCAAARVVGNTGPECGK